MNNGIYTNIGSQGSKVSGGERQRLDLARVLAKKAPILILDEPSSNLDLNTGKIIHKVIEKERKERNITVIIIGHRLNWLRSFDKLIILKNGEVENVGAHNDLILKINGTVILLIKTIVNF